MKWIYFSVFIFQNQTTIFRHSTNNSWEIELLGGEEQIDLKPENKDELFKVLNRLSNNLNRSHGLKNCQLNIIYEEKAVDYLLDFSKIKEKLQCTSWQVFRWEPIKTRIPPNQKKELENPSAKWLQKYALPVLDSISDYNEAVLNQIQIDCEDTMEGLQAKVQELMNTKNQLEKQIKAMGNPDFNTLLTFLPILYINFWGTVSPSDLALLNNSFEIPPIPSPYPEPSIVVVNSMQKKLDALPEEQQQKLRDFCELLIEYQLNIRPQMLYFFEGVNHE